MLLKKTTYSSCKCPSLRLGSRKNINQPTDHLLPRPVHRDHVMPMIVIVRLSVLRLVLFLGEWFVAHIAGCAERVDGAAEFHSVTA